MAGVKHAGTYTCVAENEAGRADLDIPLDVWCKLLLEILKMHFSTKLFSLVQYKD